MIVRLLSLTLILWLSAVLTVAHVAAQEPVPELALFTEPEATAGEDISVEALLLDPQGRPLIGETVAFFLDVGFLNVYDQVERGRAITDEDGRALVVYNLKQEGDLVVTALFDGNGASVPAEVSLPLLGAPGPATHQEQPPFRIPGANIAFVVTVLTATWALFLLVMVLLWLVGRAGMGGSETGAVQ